jgi:hypothetical protein
MCMVMTWLGTPAMCAPDAHPSLSLPYAGAMAT